MRVVRAFMTFNSNMYDVEKYLLKWLRILNGVKGLAFESEVCQLCIINLLLFLTICLIMLSDYIIIELYELSRDMNGLITL